VCDATASALEGAGAVVARWDVADPVLPLADPAYHADPRQHPDADVQALVQAADAADAFVFGTPVYHSSFSGALKNLLDHLAIAQLLYKPASLVGHGGRARNLQAVDALRLSLRSMIAITLPTTVVAAAGDYEDGRVANIEILQRVDRLAHELVTITAATRTARDALVARYA